jgi:hypothetical protein
MSTQLVSQQVRWQDLKVKSEFDIVFEIAKKEGWEDCEIFGHGDMITQPQESMGWKLIPADLYKYSIPMDAVGRLLQIINAGIRVQGVIIADDQRRTQPTPAPVKSRVSLPSIKPIALLIRRAVLGFVHSLRVVVSFSGKALLGLLKAVGVILLIGLGAYSLVYLWPLIPIGLLLLGATGSSYDPKLIVLVDDGNGGTVWVSLFTWYD